MDEQHSLSHSPKPKNSTGDIAPHSVTVADQVPYHGKKPSFHNTEISPEQTEISSGPSVHLV